MRRYGLIGYPLKNSFSLNYFNKKFAAGNIDAIYQNFALNNIAELTAIINENQDLAGLNVTIPYKQKVIPFLTHLDPIAQAINAVNTIKFKNNQLIGYNTDYWGFKKSILPLLKEWHQNALILGNGGAANAVKYVFDNLGIKYNTVSRNEENGLTYGDLDKSILRAHQIIINCTPIGMHPNIEECPNIPYQYITNLHLVYDLIYLPEETLFLKKARLNNAITKNGLSMLELQAEKAWQIWNE
ncbi:MAG: shikimate dehydrogenase [Bacteroidia bacterium]|nr:shikimate dehydrogenase [Bacteroidia bacterium]MBP9688903.1 shikimate dehydrogenase [Bacteroidia bacterium]